MTGRSSAMVKKWISSYYVVKATRAHKPYVGLFILLFKLGVEPK